jgi:hypothetical protein
MDRVGYERPSCPECRAVEAVDELGRMDRESDSLAALRDYLLREKVRRAPIAAVYWLRPTTTSPNVREWWINTLKDFVSESSHGARLPFSDDNPIFVGHLILSRDESAASWFVIVRGVWSHGVNTRASITWRDDENGKESVTLLGRTLPGEMRLDDADVERKARATRERLMRLRPVYYVAISQQLQDGGGWQNLESVSALRGRVARLHGSISLAP